MAIDGTVLDPESSPRSPGRNQVDGLPAASSDVSALFGWKSLSCDKSMNSFVSKSFSLTRRGFIWVDCYQYEPLEKFLLRDYYANVRVRGDQKWRKLEKLNYPKIQQTKRQASPYEIFSWDKMTRRAFLRKLSEGYATPIRLVGKFLVEWPFGTFWVKKLFVR